MLRVSSRLKRTLSNGLQPEPLQLWIRHLWLVSIITTTTTADLLI